ncbi:ABC transporter permease [Thermosulfuriphilus ammonigenes]|uniref:ABC transporter permease n=1 Tax=Thermosulfuriphilus ammonigenes TaxID=1936021 RepID=A0A6G7PXZ4_9BACT|nr:ABC transporter permease [Thermosulfuriphilus ammonigenes]MBA2849500.1 ABC-2 type transport system permease protein [Thermosulfuriphilus ammonigenes]QIJ72565.1 ABC transporter permease [Thermosulfuriphilus ammonigenes]
MRASLRRIYVLTIKELLQLVRDTALIVATVYLFLVDVYIAGSGVSISLRNTLLMGLDHDRSHHSRELMARFTSPYFIYAGEVARSQEAIRLLERGEAMVVLDIPEGFEADIASGRGTEVQMLVDTSNSAIGFLAASYGGQIVATFSQDQAFERLGLKDEDLEKLPLIINRERIWFNPNQREPWFMSVSELLTVITLLTMLLPAAAMVREKERGTIEQLLVSPLGPLEIMFSKVLAMTGVILVGTAASIGFVLEPIFKVPLRGSLPLFFLATALYVFTSCGYGLFIATLARNLAQVGLLTIIAIAPIIFLSGTWTPPEAMPFWLRELMVFSPLHYYILITYGIFLKGVGLRTLWPEFLGMITLGLAIFAFGAYRFRRQF